MNKIKIAKVVAVTARLLVRFFPVIAIGVVWWLINHGRYVSAAIFVGLLIFIALADIADTIRGGFVFTTKEVADELDKSKQDQ